MVPRSRKRLRIRSVKTCSLLDVFDSYGNRPLEGKALAGISLCIIAAQGSVQHFVLGAAVRNEADAYGDVLEIPAFEERVRVVAMARDLQRVIVSNAVRAADSCAL